MVFFSEEHDSLMKGRKQYREPGKGLDQRIDTARAAVAMFDEILLREGHVGEARQDKSPNTPFRQVTGVASQIIVVPLRNVGMVQTALEDVSHAKKGP